MGLLLVLLCLGLGACSSLSPRQAPRPNATYTLDETGSIAPSNRPLCRTIAVSAVRAAPGYGSARMAYTREAHKIEFFAYHKWADSPASMLYPLLLGGLEKSGRFGLVLPDTAGDDSGPRLETELIMLRQRFEGNASRLDLALRARLFVNEQILTSRVFRLEEEAGSGPESGVEAANRATGHLLDELIRWMDEALAKAQPACRR